MSILTLLKILQTKMLNKLTLNGIPMYLLEGLTLYDRSNYYNEFVFNNIAININEKEGKNII